VLVVLIAFPRGLAGLVYDLRDHGVAALAHRREAAAPPARPGTLEPVAAP
jgi:hypothetical protein